MPLNSKTLKTHRSDPDRTLSLPKQMMHVHAPYGRLWTYTLGTYGIYIQADGWKMHLNTTSAYAHTGRSYIYIQHPYVYIRADGWKMHLHTCPHVYIRRINTAIRGRGSIFIRRESCILHTAYAYMHTGGKLHLTYGVCIHAYG
jgi:hypothetical protein